MHAQVVCPQKKLLKDLLDGALAKGLETQLADHLSTCSRCQQIMESFTVSTVDDVRRQLQQGPDQRRLSAKLQQTMQRLKDQTPAPEELGESDWCETVLLQSLAPSQTPEHLGRLGSYEVVEIIGRGGFGVVFKGFDPSLNRFVALKVLAPHLASNAAARKRFAREARAAAAVRDEHVVAIHNVEEANGLPYLVMEYISGVSLQQRLDCNGPLDLEEILRIGRQTAAGLAAAHAQGLIHRDIKPANILLENNVERVKITDFGLARAADDAGLTQSGTLAGTPQYMAPEQARGEPLDHRADLFSLGSVLYALCTGRPPFRAANTLGVIRRISEEAPRPIRQINPSIPPWLEEIISILQAKDPAQRFSSAAEIADLLGQYLAHVQQPQTAPRPAVPRLKRSNPRKQAMPWIFAAACLIGGLGLFALFPDAPPEPAKDPLEGANYFYQDFRGKPIDKNFFLFTGQKAERQIKAEDEGVRITLPAEGTQPMPTGLVAKFQVAGDFEITTSYELLKADKPAGGDGVGVQLYIVMESPTQEAVVFGRYNTPLEGGVFNCGRMTTREGKREYDHATFSASKIHSTLLGKSRGDAPNDPADYVAGRLRLSRRGSLVTFLVAEKNSDDFLPLHEFELGTADLKTVRVAADTGFTKNPVEVRISDFEIRAAGVPQEGSPSALRGRRRWLYPTLAISALVLCATGFWYWRRRRPQEKPAKPATNPPAPAPSRSPVPDQRLRKGRIE